MTTEVFYRYEDVAYAGSLNEFDESVRGSGELRVNLREYRVARHTPCGVWIELVLGAKRFINTQRRKQFAHATREAALESFIARKERQEEIHQARANRAKNAAAWARMLRNRGKELSVATNAAWEETYS